VLAVFGATVSFIVVKYVTDDSLRNSTETVREDNYKDLSQDKIEVALCPCRNETFFWSTFVTYKEPLNTNYTEQVQLCQQAIVPQLKTAAPPTPTSPLKDVQAYITYLDILRENVATQVACSIAIQEILQALDPNPEAHIIGLGDNFYSTELLSERQARQRVDTFIGGKTLVYSTGFSSQLAVQRLILSQLQTNLTNVVSAAMDSNDTSVFNAVEATAYGFDLYANITNDALTTLQNTASNQAYTDRLLNTLKAAVDIDYVKYADACMPYYCDYTQRKSAWSRLTEFLGLLGGLYTTFLGIGFTAWFLVDLLLPVGHGRIMV
jgi:hypothetical protein